MEAKSSRAGPCPPEAEPERLPTTPWAKAAGRAEEGPTALRKRAAEPEPEGPMGLEPEEPTGLEQGEPTGLEPER